MHIEKKTLRNIFLGVGACILLYWMLHETERVKAVIDHISAVLFPFVFGASFAFVLNVPMRAIESKLLKVKNNTIRRICAMLISVIAILLVLSIVFWLLIPQVVDTAQLLWPKLKDFFINTETSVSGFLSSKPRFMQWVKENVGIEQFNLADLAQKAISMIGSSVSAILAGAFSAIVSISGILFNIIIGTVFAIYCLFQKETLARQGKKLLYAFLPERFSDEVIRILRLTNSTFSNFLSGQCVEVCILGCLFAIAMAIFRMPYIPLVSVLVAVTAFIPVVGAWVGCVLGAFFILVANPLQAIWFVIMFLIIQQIENNLIYPRVVGTSIGLSGMWVLVAVAVGGELMGVAGMFLMIPIVSVLHTLLREITNKRIKSKEIDAEKLEPQPTAVKAKFHRNKKERMKKSNDEESKNK